MITLTPNAARASVLADGRGGLVPEDYFSLVHWLRAMGDMSGVTPKTIGVTSCARRAGVSTVASNLAIAAAGIGDQPVLLLDLSVTHHRPSTRTSPPAELTLREALEHASLPGEFAKASPVPNLSVLALTEADDPQALNVDYGKVNDLLRELDHEFGFIVVDMPTVDSSLCFVAAGMMSGMLLVVEAERTRSDLAARAKQRLIDARANVLGVILNKRPQHMPDWLEARL